MKNTQLMVLALVGLMAAPLHADFFGLANGRTANFDNLADMSVEVGVNLESDLKTFGTRFNYKYSPNIVFFADLGRTEFFDDSSLSYGFGGFYQLRNVTLLENTDLALKGSFHATEISDVDLSEFTIEALISGDQLATTNLAWYGNVGLHFIDAGDNETELGFGGGVVGDAGVGEWYAGLDFIDELFVVGGFRYNIQ